MNIRSVCEIPSDFSNKNPRNSEGAFVTLKDGRIAFFYTRYNGEHGGDHDTADIVVRYSADNGETWSDYTVIYRGPAHGNAMSCSSLRLQDGRIMLVFLIKRRIKGMDAETDDVMDCRPFATFSSDECRTWTTPRCMVRAPGYYVGNNDRLVQLDDGGWFWALGGTQSDVDTTGRVLQIISGVAQVQAPDAYARAGDWLAEIQLPEGDWNTGATPGPANSNSTALAVGGLLAAGHDPQAAPYLKGGVSALEALLAFQEPSGAFIYINLPGQEEVRVMATADALTALAPLISGGPVCKSIYLPVLLAH